MRIETPATAVGSFTCAVLAARKLLMHAAVDKGAKAGDYFVAYVKYLADEHWVPPNGKPWVEKIKDDGNEANHEITIKNKKEAEHLLYFVQVVLMFMYEVASKLNPPKG